MLYYISFVWLNINILIIRKGNLFFKGIKLGKWQVYIFISFVNLLILESLTKVMEYYISNNPKLTYKKILQKFFKSQLFIVFILGVIIHCVLPINY